MSTAVSVWLSAHAASKRAGESVFTIQNWAICGRIRTKVETGRTPKFHAEDIDRIVAERNEAEPSHVATANT